VNELLVAEKVVILTQGNSKQPMMLEIANDKDHNASSLAFSLDVNNVFIAATVCTLYLTFQSFFLKPQTLNLMIHSISLCAKWKLFFGHILDE
jgi:hypothetical protein